MRFVSERTYLTAIGLALGGNARAGLEDCLYVGKGVLAQNTQLVQQTIELAKVLGVQPANVATTEALLRLPRR